MAAGAHSAAHVPDAVAPPPHNPRFPLLDGMRAIAVLAVVLVHVTVYAKVGSAPIPRVLMHLNFGVTLFFLISGFLLYRPFIAHRGQGAKAPGIGVYAKRRALRIIPAYWAVLTALTLLPGLTGVSGGHWLSQYSLTFTLPFADGANGCSTNIGCGLGQTWSLVVELSFYAALPLWFLVSERLARLSGKSWPLAELGALAILAIVSVVFHFSIADDTSVTTYIGGTVLGYVLWFALGMGMAVVSVAAEGKNAPALDVIGRHAGAFWIAGIAAYAALCWRLPATPFVLERDQQLAVHLLFGLAALLLMLPAVFTGDGRGLPRAILRHPAVAWIGLVSYGIFLWHYVVTLELGNQNHDLSFWPLLAATFAITIPIAALSYYALERPLLRFKYRRIDKPAAPRRTPAAG